ncbi:acyl-CoA synthetase [Terasakiella sp. A23]|uniref:acyl-CoA synthetase n=1 Tax=Terasakiella sp. FCG-A23 TaxID=3080561 RepID=UPI002955C726|nr:acyl-CoA synthetase [Terasakiella sp. A23]MDV7339383.1 acyl-CoA synthetase [Terasakiella sp. A23]
MAKVAAKKRGSGGSGLMLLGFMALFAAVILLLVSMASLVLVCFGLLPTFVAVLIDRSPQRFAFFSVFAMNFAGIFPFLLDLWMGSNSMSVAIDSLTDVFSLFTMYGLAALGWVLFAVTPPIVTTVMTFIAQRRVAILRAKQKKLLQEWGEDVTGENSTVPNGEEAEPGAPPSEPAAPKAPKT